MHLHISYIMAFHIMAFYFQIENNTEYYSLMILVILEVATCK